MGLPKLSPRYPPHPLGRLAGGRPVSYGSVGGKTNYRGTYLAKCEIIISCLFAVPSARGSSLATSTRGVGVEVYCGTHFF